MIGISLFIILQITLSIPTQQQLSIAMSTLFISKKTPLLQHRCQGFVVNSNYRKIQLLINPKSSNNILVTDYLITQDCSEAALSVCPHNSTFCINSKSFSGSNRLAIGKCLEEFYVYFYIKDFQGGDISAKFSSNDGCDNIPESQYTQCATIPLPLCGVIHPSESCNKKCFKLQCSYIDSLKRNISSLSTCLPSFIQKQRLNEICNSENHYYNSVTKFPSSNYCGGKNSHGIPKSIGQIKQLSFGQLIFYLFMIALIIFIFSVIWYRIQLSRTGRAPFNPPGWMPQIIYPRRRSQVFQQQKQLETYHKI